MLKLLIASFFVLTASLPALADAGAPRVTRPYIFIDSPMVVGETPSAGQFEFRVRFQNVNSEKDTWSLYALYDDATALTPVVIDIPVSITTLTWDMTMMDAGTYNFVGVLTSGGTVVTATAPGNIFKD